MNMFSKFRGLKADQGKIKNRNQIYPSSVVDRLDSGPTTLIWMRTEVKIVLLNPGYIESYLLSFSRDPEKSWNFEKG